MRASRATSILLAAVVATAGVVPAAVAEAPFPTPPAGGVYDWADHLFLDSGDCSAGNASDNQLPGNFDCERDWKYTDHREPAGPTDTYDPLVANNPQELFGVKGTGVNRAWEVSTGRPDVVIAVLDSGIRWEEGGSTLADLIEKHYLNRQELPLPQVGDAPATANPGDTRFDGYDVNGDGIFNVLDYGDDPRTSDLNGNGVVDPEDLVRTFSDGVDDDGNGYVDDISGWDFFEDDNNPQDDVDYGHGTGEARDSTAEAGEGEDGMCPNCMHLPMRVGDSFVADVNHWAEAVVYAVDNGAGVIQEALGTLNHTSFGQAAADHAYRNGVIINASEADEAAGHHMWPAAYDHTMVVNSIRTPTLPTSRPHSYLYFNGCTNFGGYTYVAIPSTSCSSEATGRSSGVSGLAQSAARNAVERGEMTDYVRDDGTEAEFALSAEELMQLWRLSADDIDFSSPCPVHALCDDAGEYGVAAPAAPADNYATTIPGTTRYQTVQGWDYFTGYGRSNAARLLGYLGRPGREHVGGVAQLGDDPSLAAQDRIPPEADITWPRWWQQYAYDPATGELLLPDDPDQPQQLLVHGRAAANRVTAAGGSFDYVVEWAPHVQGERFPASQNPLLAPPGDSGERSTGPWTEAARVTGLTAAVEGELARIDLAAVRQAQLTSLNPFDPATDPTSEFQPERHAVRLRVRVIAHPVDPADTVNNEAVRQKQVDVYPAGEAFVRDDLGMPFTEGTDGIGTQDAVNAATGALGRYSGGAGSPSFHDLDGDGVDELLLPTSDGVVHAYTDVATGEELPGWPVLVGQLPSLARHTTGDGSTPVGNAYTRGEVTDAVHGSILLGTLAVADLDDDGDLEVSIGDLEGRLHVWEHTGEPRAGFPVSVDPARSKEPTCEGRGLAAGGDGLCDDYASRPDQGTPAGSLHGDGDRQRDRWNARDWGINSAPAVGDLDPTTPGLELVVGSNDAHVYAWHADGTPVEGWPVVLRDPAKVAEMDAATGWYRYTDDAGQAIGTKVLVSPALGDLDGNGDLEVVIGVNEEYAEDVNASALDPVPMVVDGVAGSGNTRVYALHHTGAASPGTAATDETAHTQDQAYVDGWPVPIALAVLDLLPYVAAGPNTQPVLYDAEGDGTLEVAVSPADGPGYILDHDGSSWLGQGPDGKHRTLSTRSGAGSRAQDLPTLVALGSLAVGSLDGGNHLSLVGPGAGLRRLVDVLLEGDQAGAEDHVLAWNASVPTGEAEPGWPVVVNDLQFLTPPVIADVDGDGLAEAIQSTAMGDTVAAGLAGGDATVVRHFTGGWTVAAATVGDAPLGAADDDRLHLAGVTREGYLRLWPTPTAAGSEAACRALSEWPEYGHDAANTGNYGVDAERPAALTDLTVDGDARVATLGFTATGDDRRCGSARRYEVRVQPGNGPPDWHAAVPVDGDLPAPAPAGTPESFEVDLGRRGPSLVLVRAFDDAGNGSQLAAARTGPPGRGRGGPGGPPPAADLPGAGTGHLAGVAALAATPAADTSSTGLAGVALLVALAAARLASSRRRAGRS
jgi:hypothetical protein